MMLINNLNDSNSIEIVNLKIPWGLWFYRSIFKQRVNSSRFITIKLLTPTLLLKSKGDHRYIHTYIHTYMHACIHTQIHTYIHACMHACMHAYIHKCMHTYTDTYIHACMHAYIHTCIHNPPWNFLYTIATVKLGKMVRFNPLLCLGYLPSINVCNFIEDLGVSGSIEISRWMQHWVPVSWESWGLRFYSGICSLWMSCSSIL